MTTANSFRKLSELSRTSYGYPVSCVHTNGVATSGIKGITMYTVIKQEAPDRWVKELYFQTEFRAYLCALTKSKALMATYMVVDTDTNEVTSIVRHGKPLIA